ncbi:MAG: Adenine permease AdeP [Phycisphaerae bacterium]|nr:Adenine permease AdeP [Phycisphaerae bacterium]
MFRIAERGSTVTREVVGGVSTFMALSYIIFVNPAILSAAGMPHDQVMLATCVSAAVGCLLMAFLANYPVAQAPAMGHNAFFAYTVCGAGVAGAASVLTWQQGLAAVFCSGALFVALSLFGFRSAVLNSIPDALKKSIAAGIGLFIALIGMQYGGLIVDHPATLVTLGHLTSPVALTCLGGLAIIMVLTAWRIRGAVLLGILATGGIAAALGLARWPGQVVSAPANPMSTLGKMDFAGLFDLHTHGWTGLVTIIFVLFFLDLFDTVGTLVGVAERAGFLDEKGRLPRAERALLADATATVVGATLGTSTVSSYIESAAGVTDGARTGLASVVTAALLLASIFFLPLARFIGGEMGGPSLHPIIAPGLIAVGAMMLTVVKDIRWDDPTEGIPAFLTLTVIPFSYSISDGIAFGFIAYALAKLLSGRPRQCPWLVYLFAALFVLKYALVR